MAASILAIIATLVGLGAWWWKRRAARQESPLDQNRERYRQIDDDIASGDAAQNAAHLASDLDECDRLLRERDRKLREQHASQSDLSRSNTPKTEIGGDTKGTS